MKDKIEKLNTLQFKYEKHKLIYEWVKTGKITLQQFLELIELTN
jgi:polyhydroxyalkanoate synthesis regulator phasin